MCFCTYCTYENTCAIMYGMSGDSTNTNDVRYSSRDIKTNRKDQSGFFTNVRQRINIRGFVKGILPERKDGRKFIIVGVGALALIVVSSVILVLVLRDDDIPVISPEEQIGVFREDLVQFRLNEELDSDSFEELVMEIETFIELHNGDNDLVVEARSILSGLYYLNGDVWMATSVLNDGLNASDLSSNNKLDLLVALVDIYGRTGQIDGQVNAIWQITELPDDIVLELEDWSSVKEYYKSRLDQLVNSGG